MDEMLRRWGENIRKGREALGWNQTVLARVVGVSQGSVARWERGEMQPSRHHMAALCRALGDGLFPINGETQ